MTDVAQALYDDPTIAANMRVYSIGSRNTTNDPASRNYIYNTHPHLWWIETHSTFRGMYLGGNQSGDLSNTTFVSTHVDKHGALGNLYAAKSRTLKMGDTPSVLYLLSPLVGRVGNWDNPTSNSWGGKFTSTGHGANYWTDITGDHKVDRVHVNTWREQYLRDFQQRLERTPNAPPSAAPLPPPPAPAPSPSAPSPADTVHMTLVNYNKSTDLQVAATSSAPGGSVTLTARMTTNGITTTLGTLRYKSSEGIYRSSFSKVGPKPTSGTVISTGGGAATESVP
jgi:hypothetical protein